MHLPWTPPRLITAATSYSGGIIRYSIIREEMTDTRTRDCTVSYCITMFSSWASYSAVLYLASTTHKMLCLNCGNLLETIRPTEGELVT